MGAGHFCRPLHVAMQFGLYHRFECGIHPIVWRKVSEDFASDVDAIFPADYLHSELCHC